MTEIRPTAPQYKFIMSEAQFPAFVGGYSSGKSEALVNRLILLKLQYPKQSMAYYAPTYDLIRMIAWPRFEARLKDLGIPYRLAKMPLNLIDLGSYGLIYFRSMDQPSRIVGYEVADSAIDELDTLPTDEAAYCWRQIIARCREKKPIIPGEDKPRPNTTAVATTPEGFRFVYQQWERDKPKGCELIRASTMSNPYVSQEYIDSIRAMYPSHLLKAYLEGEFVNLVSGTVYRNYDRNLNRSTETVVPKEPLYIGMDFNVTKQCAVVYVKREAGKVWHAVDEFIDMYDTPEAVKKIKTKYPDHEVIAYPDASGYSRKSVDASRSDIWLLKQAGFSVRAPRKNPPVKDRVASANSAFEKGLVMVNDLSCPRMADNLEQQVYDQNGEPDKRNNQDHTNDAATYPLVYEMPIKRPAVAFNVSFSR